MYTASNKLKTFLIIFFGLFFGILFSSGVSFASDTFSVTVPTGLSVSVDSKGALASSKLEVANNGDVPIKITKVQSSALNSWTALPYATTNYATGVKVNSKNFSMLIDGTDIRSNPAVSGYISAGSKKEVSMDLKVAPQAQNISGQNISNLVMTIAAATPSKIEITTPPSRTVYPAGSNFDPSGMVVTATYEDGSTKVIDNYSVTNSSSLSDDQSSVSLSYTLGSTTVTATQPISVYTYSLRVTPKDGNQVPADSTITTDLFDIVLVPQGYPKGVFKADNSAFTVNVTKAPHTYSDFDVTVAIDPNGKYKEYGSLSDTVTLAVRVDYDITVTPLFNNKITTDTVINDEKLFFTHMEGSNGALLEFGPVDTVSSVITSPNYPNAYPSYMSESSYSFPYFVDSSYDGALIVFSDDAYLYSNTTVRIYDSSNVLKYTITNATGVAGKSFLVPGNSGKITMQSSYNYTATGFAANIYPVKNCEMYDSVALHSSPLKAPKQEGDFTVSFTFDPSDESLEFGNISTSVTLNAVFPSYAMLYDTDNDGVGDELVFQRGDLPDPSKVFIRAFSDVSGSNNTTSYSGFKSGIRTMVFKDKIYSPSGANYMFESCTALESIYNISNLDVSKCSSIDFDGCTNLTYLDLSSWDTSSLTSINQMFDNCTSLKYLNLSGWDTSNINDLVYDEDEEEWVYGSSSWTSTYGAFEYCSSLETLITDGWDTSGFCTLQQMFYGCSSLSTLDLSSWSTDSIVEMSYAFGNCRKLKTIYVDPDKWTLPVFNSSHDIDYYDYGIFESCNALIGQNGVHPSGSYSTAMRGYAFVGTNSNSGAMTDVAFKNDSKAYAILYSDGELVFQRSSSSDGRTVLATYTGFEDADAYTSSSSVPWYSNLSKIKKVTVKQYIRPLNTAYWFYGATNLSSADITKILTCNLASSKYMFYNCYNMTSITGFDSWNPRAEDYSYMFYNCQKLSSVTLPIFYAAGSRVSSYYYYDDDDEDWDDDDYYYDYYDTTVQDVNANMSYMFASCSGLTSATLKSMSNSPNLSYMFQNCSKLSSIVTTSFTGTPINMQGMFYGCPITSIDLSKLSTVALANSSYLFYNCTSLVTVDLSKWSTPLLTNTAYMFYGDTKLTTVYATDSWYKGAVTSSTNMFYNCSSIKGGNGTSYNSSYHDISRGNIDIPNNAGYFTQGTDSSDVWAALYSDGRLVFGTGTNSDTANLTTTFTGFRNLDFTSYSTVPWNAYRSQITSVKFNKSFTVNSVNYWFYNCTNLTTIYNYTYLKFQKSANYLFYNCYNLATFYEYYYSGNRVTYTHALPSVSANYMFYNCQKINSIVFTGTADTLTYANGMFQSCTSLTTITVPNKWNPAALTTGNSSNMFYGCSNLRGMNGTSYSSSYVNSARAVIDNSSHAGYLTSSGADGYAYLVDTDSDNVGDMLFISKNQVSASTAGGAIKNTWWMNDTDVFTSASSAPWYSYRNNIKTIKFYRSDGGTTSSYRYNYLPRRVNCDYMFAGLTNLTSVINFQGFYNATSYKYLFSGCTSLTNINLQYLYFDSSYSTDVSYMFNGCSNLKTIYSGNKATVSYTSSQFSSIKTSDNMFYGCSKLVGGEGTTYSASHLDKDYAKTDHPLNPGYFTYVGDAINSSYYALVYDTNNDGVADEIVFQYGSSVTTGKTLLATYGNFANAHYTSESQVPWKAYRSSVSTVTLNSVSSSSVAYWFYGFTNLQTVTSPNRLVESGVDDMRYLFYNCSKLTSLNFSTDNPCNCRYFDYAFYGCSNLTTISVASDWTLPVHQSSTNMFYGCSSLVGGYGTSYNSSYTDKTRARADDSLGVGYFTAVAGTNGSYPLYNISLVDFDGDGYADTLYFSDSLVNLSKQINGKYVAGTRLAFFTRYNDYAWYTNGAAPFASSKNVPYSVKYITEISGNPKKSLNMSYWFYGATNLTTIPQSILTNVTKAEYTFASCPSLRKVSISYSSSGILTSTASMFYNCQNLNDVSFSYTGGTASLATLTSMFNNCTNLVRVNLGATKVTSNATLSSMFYNCQKLLRIYASSNFGIGSSASGNDNVFYNCLKVVGGNGTTYNSSYRGRSYAVIDASGTPGYLTDYKLAGVDDITDDWFSGIDNPDKDTTPYAVLYNDGRFVFMEGYPSDTSSVTKIFSGFDVAKYDSYTQIPWYQYRDQVKSVTLNLDITPSSTAYWFYDMQNLSSFTVNKDIMANVTDVRYMFYNCKNLSSQPAGLSFDNGLITDFSHLFHGCECIKSLDITSFNTSASTNFASMFEGMSSLKTVSLGTINTTKGTDFNSMFKGCSSLTSIDTTYLYVNNATDISHMFDGCSSLTSLDVSGFTTSKVTNMAGLFKDCSNVAKIDVSGFDVSKVTNMGDITGGIFEGCSSVTFLDLTNWNTAALKSAKYMFANNESLVSIYVGDNFTVSNVTASENMFHNAREIVGENGMTYNSMKTNKEYARIDTDENPGYLSSDPYVAVLYSDGSFVFQFGRDYDTTKTITATYSKFMGTVYSSYSAVPWYANRTKIKTVDFKDMIAPKGTQYWFYNCTVLTSVAHPENLNTEKCTSLFDMFYGCSALTSLDMNSWDTKRVVNMSNMFYGCTKLTTLNAKDINTSQVTTFASMFYNCQVLSSIDPSLWNTGNATTFANMFYNCYKVASLNLNSWDVKKLTTAQGMFYNCSALTSVSLKDWNTVALQNASQMFLNCSNTSFTSIDLSNWNTEKLTTTASMFQGCTNLATVNISFWNTPLLNTTSSMFYNCQKLTSVDLSRLTMTKVGNMSSMFYNCYVLDTPFNALKTWDTSTATNMASMFYNCYKGNFSDIGNWNTANVTSMNSMFYGASTGISNATINVSNWNTAKVTSMSAMFQGCTTASSIPVSNFDTGKVTNFANMFNGCSNLSSLDVSSFTTDIATSMEYMFYNCSKLQSLDLSSWCTAQVTSFRYMFSGCTNLETIYASNFFVTTRSTSTTYYRYVFTNCTKLKGGNGTAYSSSYTDKTYARIDASGTPGYFTAKSNSTLNALLYTDGSFDIQIGDTVDSARTLNYAYTKINRLNTTGTGNVLWYNQRTLIKSVDIKEGKMPSSMAYWFYGATNLTSFKIENPVDMSLLTNVAYMFYGCSNLTDLDSFNNWNTPLLLTMNNMFQSCTKLVSIDLTNINMNSVTTMANMFQGCTALETFKSGAHTMSSLTNMYYLFVGDNALDEVDFTGFVGGSKNINGSYMFYNSTTMDKLSLINMPTAYISNYQYMFNNCRALTTIYVTAGTFGTHVTTGASHTYMFNNDTNLKGGNGTAFSTSYTNGTYARIDASGTPGYFTDISTKLLSALEFEEELLEDEEVLSEEELEDNHKDSEIFIDDSLLTENESEIELSEDDELEIIDNNSDDEKKSSDENDSEDSKEPVSDTSDEDLPYSSGDNKKSHDSHQDADIPSKDDDSSSDDSPEQDNIPSGGDDKIPVIKEESLSEESDEIEL